ncbi:MAG: sulfatase-like hydrolase/transferase [Fuerstiella sp.]|nr:sulfatase-like hydrolase/transferase [Fuerstiella sp.]MCP4856611.1 sulfatase-like hydrolase/transferase [Fuerstiella sp.]
MKHPSIPVVLLLSILIDSANAKPNIIFIITDDQSWDSLGFMDGKVSTPRIDQMACEGLYLTNFNVTSTVCSPSRYSFLTGRFAGRCEGRAFLAEHPHGDQTQVENIGELEPDGWNLARILQANGYRPASLVSPTSSATIGCTQEDMFKKAGTRWRRIPRMPIRGIRKSMQKCNATISDGAMKSRNMDSTSLTESTQPISKNCIVMRSMFTIWTGLSRRPSTFLRPQNRKMRNPFFSTFPRHSITVLPRGSTGFRWMRIRA